MATGRKVKFGERFGYKRSNKLRWMMIGLRRGWMRKKLFLLFSLDLKTFQKLNENFQYQGLRVCKNFLVPRANATYTMIELFKDKKLIVTWFESENDIWRREEKKKQSHSQLLSLTPQTPLFKNAWENKQLINYVANTHKSRFESAVVSNLIWILTFIWDYI